MPDDVRPTPDPTVLTTEALERGLAAERDFTIGRIAVLEQRLHGMDVATEVLQETVTRVPTETQREVGHLRELTDEKFVSVQTQFKERDTRQERESKDNKVAVDAAFAAQKEAAAKQDESNLKAIDKSERATAETIKTNADLNRTELRGLANSFADLKDRITAIENRKQGGTDVSTSNRANVSNIIAALAVGLAAILGVYAALKP